MKKQIPATRWTRDTMMAVIRALAEKLGRAPTMPELTREHGIKHHHMQRRFGNYRNALTACGLEWRGGGRRLEVEDLFTDWARIVREIGKVPTAPEYRMRSKYSPDPLCDRFRYWDQVPGGLLHYAREHGLEKDWADVLEIAEKHCRTTGKAKAGSRVATVPAFTPRVIPGRPLCGAPLTGSVLGFAPVNEMGVVYLFGAMAGKLGFVVTWMGTEYPDCEAFREVKSGRWQHVRIEFEFLSRNFLLHSHDPARCDLVVCWDHNWAECPLEVLELKQAVPLTVAGAAVEHSS